MDKTTKDFSAFTNIDFVNGEDGSISLNDFVDITDWPLRAIAFTNTEIRLKTINNRVLVIKACPDINTDVRLTYKMEDGEK